MNKSIFPLLALLDSEPASETAEAPKRNPIETKQLSETIWLLNDNNEATGYVVVGKEKAAVIDTMNGFENVEHVVRKITNLPLVLINTHGHCDHIYGNMYFNQKAFIGKKDEGVAKEHLSFPEFKDFFKENKKKLNLKKPRFSYAKDGDVFDLGGITLKVIDFPAHTPGGILLLDAQDRVLFTGDSINRHLWMQLETSLPLGVLSDSLKKIESLTGTYDRILHGHAQNFEPASLYTELCEAVQEVIDGKTAEDSPYTYFMGTCTQHKYTKGDVTIVYNKN